VWKTERSVCTAYVLGHGCAHTHTQLMYRDMAAHTHTHTHTRHTMNVPALSFTFYTTRSATVITNVVTFDLSIRRSIKNECAFNILVVERLVKCSLSVGAVVCQ
jgi:hypothetical protein